MGPEGHKMICDALAEANIDANVTPVPEESGENVEFITVQPEKILKPAEVLNILVAKHSKFYDESGLHGRHYERRKIPWLSIVSIEEGSITLRDRNTMDFDWGPSL